MRGDCITCKKLGRCQETDEEKVLSSYTCPLFTAVIEPVYRARIEMILRYGEAAAVKAMVQKPEELVLH